MGLAAWIEIIHVSRTYSNPGCCLFRGEGMVFLLCGQGFLIAGVHEGASAAMGSLIAGRLASALKPRISFGLGRNLGGPP